MKKKITGTTQRAFLVFALFLMALFMIPTPITPVAQAATEDELRQELSNLQSRINEANNNLAVKQQEEQTLQKEIDIFDAQIYQIQLQINATQAEIDLANTQINNLNLQIKQIEEAMKKEKELLNDYLRIIYEDSQVSIIEQIVSSDSFSDFIDRSEYLQTMQLKIKQSVEKIKKLKDEAEAKKQDLEAKKLDLDKLQGQQVAQRQGLDSQRAAKQTVLDRTQGEEAIYQAQLEESQQLFNKAQNELYDFLNQGEYVSLGRVNQGDVIGYMGTSGCSTGTHLHFEVRSGGGHTNPWTYINNGSLNMPLAQVWNGNYLQMSVDYGEYYFLGYHTGIDWHYGSAAGAPIVAAGNGDIIKRISGYPNQQNCSLGYGNYVIILHDSGLITLYGHLTQ